MEGRIPEPCNCGDPYCPQCGDPNLLRIEAAEEQLLQTLSRLNCDVYEYRIAESVAVAAVLSARRVAKQLVAAETSELRSEVEALRREFDELLERADEGR